MFFDDSTFSWLAYSIRCRDASRINYLLWKRICDKDPTLTTRECHPSWVTDTTEETTNRAHRYLGEALGNWFVFAERVYDMCEHV